MGRLNIVKMAKFPQMIYRFSITPTRIPAGCSIDTNSKMHVEPE
jgi:hypothetical protein